jgi:hypothetical protein
VIYGASPSPRSRGSSRRWCCRQGGPGGIRAGPQASHEVGYGASVPGRRHHPPCWSYAGHRELWSRKPGTTGFTQLVSLLDGSAVYISDPLPGKTHDAKAFTETPVAPIVEHSGGGIGDKGYQGCPGMSTPRKKPPSGELSKTENEHNAEISALRASVERLVAHFKSWRIYDTDYRRPYATYQETHEATRGLFFFSIIWGF